MSRVPFERLLIDVDGTLIDSNGAHAEAWARALREHGVPADVDRVRPLIGMGGDKLLPAVANISEDSDPGKAIALRKKVIFGAMLPGLRPTRGARALLEFLREQEIDLIVATSADGREAGALLRAAGVADLLPVRTSKDDAAESKPDPDIVEAALAKSAGPREMTALLGDTPYDIEAASRAGIRAIALRCGGYWSDEGLRGAAQIFDDPQALLEHWRSRARPGPDAGPRSPGRPGSRSLA